MPKCSRLRFQIRNATRQFRHHNGGGVIVTFAMFAMLLFSVIGGAIDFSRRSQVTARIQTAADTAVLAAARDPDVNQGTARQLADQMFAASTSDIVDALGKAPKLNLNFTTPAVVGIVGGAGVHGTVSFDMPTSMLQLVGWKTLSVSIAAAAAKPVIHNDIYVALDLSESMMMAVDDTERAKMEAATIARDGFACMFACHITDMPGRDPYYILAKQIGVKLRYENVLTGYNRFVTSYLDPTDPDVRAGRKRMSLIGFSDTATTLQPPTSLSAAMISAPSFFPVGKMWNTRYDVALPLIQTMMGAQGTGATASAPTKGLPIITDGIQFYRNELSDPHNGANADMSKNGPLPVALCDQIKAAGIPIAIIGMKFYIPPSGWISGYVRPFKDAITPNMMECASPGMYVEIDDTDTAALAIAYDNMLKSLNRKPTLALTR